MDELINEPRTPEFLRNIAEDVTKNVVPVKSRYRYTVAYENFENWLEKSSCKVVSENVLLAYFEELIGKYKPSSVWAHYSMLKSKLNIERNVDTSTYTRVTKSLKKNSVGYRAKKSAIFETADLERFLNDAPDDQFLAMKVVAIFGLSGACRRAELTDIRVHHVKMAAQEFIIHLPDTKTHKPRNFVVIEKYFHIVKKYVDLRPENISTDRFFLQYRNGKCSRQVIGTNKFGSFPKLIAEYLRLKNPETYTGHCFRRTSTTMLANAGASMEEVMRHGGWSSAAVAEGYIEDSIGNKRKIGNMISREIEVGESEVVPSKIRVAERELVTSGSELAISQIAVDEQDQVTSNFGGLDNIEFIDVQVSSQAKISRTDNVKCEEVTTSIKKRKAEMTLPIQLQNCSDFVVNFNYSGPRPSPI